MNSSTTPALDHALAANSPQALLRQVRRAARKPQKVDSRMNCRVLAQELQAQKCTIGSRSAPALEHALPADGPQALLGQVGRRLPGRLHDDDHRARTPQPRRHAHRLQGRQHARPRRRVPDCRLPADGHLPAVCSTTHAGMHVRAALLHAVRCCVGYIDGGFNALDVTGQHAGPRRGGPNRRPPAPAGPMATSHLFHLKPPALHALLCWLIFPRGGCCYAPG